jgi:predicted nucleic acid-binding protein
MFIASGQIGEAWAAVILEEIAKGRVSACTTVVTLQEILERFFYIGDLRLGVFMHRCLKHIAGRVLEVTVADFDASAKLFKIHPDKSPRDLFQAAVMKNNGIKEVFAIDGPDYSGIDAVNVVHLDNLIKELKLSGNHVDERTGQPQ